MKTAVLACCFAFALTGCLIVSSDKTEVEGTEVGEETLKQITPGSSEELVLSLLGPPTSRKPATDGAELLRWDYRSTRKQGTAVFLIFGGSKETTKSGSIFVILKDKQVERVWRESHPATST